MELEIFEFWNNPNFDKQYYDYCKRVEEWELNNYESYIGEDGNKRYIMDSKVHKMSEWLKSTEHQFPKFIKDFMEYFITTKFMKNTMDKYGLHNSFGVYDCASMGWRTYSGDKREPLSDTIHNILYDCFDIGMTPHYQGDHEKVVHINFKEKTAIIKRGYAVGLYGSKVIENKYPIPKYMQPQIDKLFADYDEYIKGISEK